jgi:hypothetical protein
MVRRPLDRMYGETTVVEHNGESSPFDELKPLGDDLAAEPTGSKSAGEPSGLPLAESPKEGGSAALSETDMAELADSLLKMPVGDAAPAEQTPPADQAASPADAAVPAEEEKKPAEGKDSIVIEAKPQKEKKKKKAAKSASDAKFKETLRAHRKQLEWAGLALCLVVLLGVAAIGFIFYATAIYGFSLVAIAFTLWKGRKSNSLYVTILGFALAALLTGIYCLWLELAAYQLDIRARQMRPRLGMSVPVSTKTENVSRFASASDAAQFLGSSNCACATACDALQRT